MYTFAVKCVHQCFQNGQTMKCGSQKEGRDGRDASHLEALGSSPSFQSRRKGAPILSRPSDYETTFPHPPSPLLTMHSHAGENCSLSRASLTHYSGKASSNDTGCAKLAHHAGAGGWRQWKRRLLDWLTPGTAPPADAHLQTREIMHGQACFHHALPLTPQATRLRATRPGQCSKWGGRSGFGAQKRGGMWKERALSSPAPQSWNKPGSHLQTSRCHTCNAPL